MERPSFCSIVPGHTRSPFMPLSGLVHVMVLGAAIAFTALAPSPLPPTPSTRVALPTPGTRPATTQEPPRGGEGYFAHRKGRSSEAPTIERSTTPESSDETSGSGDSEIGDPPLCLDCSGPRVPIVGAGEPPGRRGTPPIVRLTDVKPPRKLRDVRPVYPELALHAHIRGTVILECTIGTDGRISDVRVLKSVPLLDTAAVEAVRQWIYTPTLLNGAPVSVIMTVTVTFSS